MIFCKERVCTNCFIFESGMDTCHIYSDGTYIPEELTKSMTKKEFKRAMQCGLGRCIQELYTTKDIEKYRDIVLWGCTHNLAYDTQCEGTRSYYLYKMVKCYPDESTFVKAVVPYFDRSLMKAGWEFSQFCQFLKLFAQEGNRIAYNALWENYERLYHALRKKRCLHNGVFPERDNFEELCISIVNMEETVEECRAVYLKMVEKMGQLIIDNPLFDTWCFDWFQDCWENEFGKGRIRKTLKENAKNSKGIEAYYSSLLEEENIRGKLKDNRKNPETITALRIYETLQAGGTIGKDIPVLITCGMQRKGNGKEVTELAGYYKKESDLSLRIQLLRLLANRYCAASLDLDTVVQDSRSANETLQEYAFYALHNIRNGKVHDYALELLHRKEHAEDVIYMLANNYQEADQDIFVSMIKEIPVTYRENVSWHGPFRAVLDMFESSGIKHPPKELLLYMYEHSLCSFCREYILREMSRRRMLTDEILQECLYDSNDDIREFARKKMEKYDTK